MGEIAPTMPTTVEQVRAARNHMLDARAVVSEIEQQLSYASSAERPALLDRLQAAKERALDTQKEFERIGALGPALEAKERAMQMEAEQERQRAANQSEFAATQEAEARAEFERRYLAAGGTPAQFERDWPTLWKEELKRRTLAGTDALRARMLASGNYSQV